MILSNGCEIFPPYMSDEDKNRLKEAIGNRRDVIYCACKANVPDEEKLYYRLSKDNRFIPIHQEYEHAPDCSRFAGKRTSAFLAMDEKDNVKAFLKFDPLNFSTSTSSSSSSIKDDTFIDPNKREKIPKEPYLNLDSFIRCINIDAYMERLIAKNIVLSNDYFINVIRARTKKIVINGQQKSLYDINLKDDRCSFFYYRLKSVDKNEKGYWNVKLINSTNKIYNFGISATIMKRALKQFNKNYIGQKLEDNEDVMVAGFIYRRTSRNTMKDYYTIGRIHIFLRTHYEGIYCSNIYEKQIFELILKYRHKQNKSLKLLIPTTVEEYACQIEVDNKIGNIYIGKNSSQSTDNPYLECNFNELTPEELVDFITKIKES